MGKIIPNKDVDFDTKQRVIVTAANANILAWNLDALWMNNVIDSKKMVWDKAWAEYLNPKMRTPVITFTKREARKSYEPSLRQLIQILEYNPRISVEELKAMGIEVRPHNRTPVPIATTYPVYTIDSSVIRNLKVHFHDQNSLHKAKPYGQHGAEIRWAILPAPPINVEDLTHSDFDTSSPFALTFDEADRAQTIYFCLRWENTRGERGPWGEIVSAIIP
ncbi:MAG: hypothetical protein LBT83_05020 [Tannerella sp.]|jgi:hypothetical protein|nr:hypothetical protein [Tannerella sp.]